MYIGGHRIPDGNSLWRAKENQVTLCICCFPAPLLLPGRSEVADGKCYLRPKTGFCTASMGAVGPRTFSINVYRSRGTPHCGAVPTEVHPVPPYTSGLLLVGSSHAGAHPSDASALYQMLLQDAGPSAALHLHTPPGWPCHKRCHGAAVTSWPVLDAAHYDAGTAACCPPRVGVLTPLCFLPLLSFLSV